MAPNIKPPLRITANGLAYTGLAKCIKPLNTNTVAMMHTGMCQVMTFFQSMYAKPSKRAMAQTSPVVPAPKPSPVAPKRRLRESGNC